MDWQQLASLGIVAVTVLLMVRGTVRPRNTHSHSPCDACRKGFGKEHQSF